MKLGTKYLRVCSTRIQTTDETMRAQSQTLILVLALVFTVRSAMAQTNTNIADIYFPHEHVTKFTVTEADLPFEKQMLMKEHDAVVFVLPQKRSVSIWCYKPDDTFFLAEQTTKSGLKTAWGEKPWIRPNSKYERIGENSYTSGGWDSYIELEGVVTSGDRQSDYTLYVRRLKVSIIEDLTATNALPVTIRITRTNRQPKQDDTTQLDRSNTNGVSPAANSAR